MTAADLREWLKSVSIAGWEWSETNGWVSASQLRSAPPVGHLFAYLLASKFLVPMRVPPEAWEPKVGIMIDDTRWWFTCPAINT